MFRRARRFLILSAALVALTSALVPSAANAAETQRVLFDHRGQQTANSYFEPAGNQPANWVSPANYRDGRIYIRLEVISKPSSLPVQGLLCLWRHGTKKFQYETCGGGKTMRFSDEGVYWVDAGTPGKWWKKKGGWDFTKPASVMRIMLKDPATGKLLLSSKCGATCFQGDVSQHVPVEMRATVIMVASGAKLNPPAEWRGKCPAAWAAGCAAAA